MDLTNLTLDELTSLKKEVSAKIKEVRAEVSEQEKVEKAKREEENKNALEPGQTVDFLYNKKTYSGKVVRLSEKSVTIAFELDGVTVKKYRKYSDVLRVA